jgi:hypothetical protein
MQFSKTQLAAIHKRLLRSSYRRLSKEIGVPISNIYNAQSNREKDYRVSTLEKFAVMLGIPLWYFLFLAEIDNGTAPAAIRNAASNQYPY